MSLRNYLFTLIGSLILLLTCAQLILVYWINSHIAEEVNSQAKILSKHAIKMAVEEIEMEFESIEHDSAEQNEQQKPARTIHRVIQHQTEGSVDVEVLKKHLNTLVDKIHSEELERVENPTILTNVASSYSPENRHLIIQKKSEVNNTDKLIHAIQIMILVCAVIAIAFAYWLSTKFNKPLRELATGFKQLSEGSYDHVVPVQGVKEIRETICLFNAMVKRVEDLTEAEGHNKELHHLAELGEVSRGLAHALRNPMHTIGLSIDQLQQSDLSKHQQNELIVTIKNKIHHIDNSIKALLTLTTNGISRTDKVPLIAIIQDIVLEYKSCANKQINFIIDVPTTIEITGAESEFRSILHTIIINACEASTPKSEVNIHASLVNQDLIINVIDHGAGLSDSVLEHLFKPHVSTKPEGAGMGLYIARRIINLHYQGDIHLDNVVDSENGIIGCKASIVLKDNS